MNPRRYMARRVKTKSRLRLWAEEIATLLLTIIVMASLWALLVMLVA